MHPSPRGTQLATRGILRSLFPSWLPGAFAAMFSRPLPGLSCQLNAWASVVGCWGRLAYWLHRPGPAGGTTAQQSMVSRQGMLPARALVSVWAQPDLGSFHSVQ